MIRMADATNETVMPFSEATASDNSTSIGLFGSNDSPDAFLYIVVVLSFYAFAMIVLMVKYIRRENQEAELSFYFTEFIKRDKFQSPTYQNKLNVDCTRRVLDAFEFYRPLELHESAV